MINVMLNSLHGASYQHIRAVITTIQEKTVEFNHSILRSCGCCDAERHGPTLPVSSSSRTVRRTWLLSVTGPKFVDTLAQ